MTERYLLFDSGCAVCTRLADDIERASDGWLQARSLRDPDVKTLLDAAKPGWRWEPTLLEVADGQPRVFTGMAMRARMALGLGPRRAWRMIQLVERASIPLSQIGSPSSPKRRSFLKQALAGFAAVPFVKLSPDKPSNPDVFPPGTSDVMVHEVSDVEAQKLIQQAQASSSVQVMRQNLLQEGYKPIYNQAFVRNISWKDVSGLHNAFFGNTASRKGYQRSFGFHPVRNY